MIIRQFKSGLLHNFSYLLGCEETNDAIIIDPAGNVNKIITVAGNLNLNVKYIINTHGHIDHTIRNKKCKKLTGYLIIMHKADVRLFKSSFLFLYSTADIIIDREKSIVFGNRSINIIHTPGHSPGGICLYTDGNLFTGDTLFVGDTGRTDLKGGDRSALGESLRKLMQLPDDTIVWPGHDYGQMKRSTLGWEKKNNINAKEYGFYSENGAGDKE